MPYLFGRRTINFCFGNVLLIVVNLIVWTYRPAERPSLTVPIHRVVDDVIDVGRDSNNDVDVAGDANRQRRSSRRQCDCHNSSTGINDRTSGTTVNSDAIDASVSKPTSVVLNEDVLEKLNKSSLFKRLQRSKSTRNRQYQVPSIEYTKLVECPSLLAGNSAELNKAAEILKTQPKVPIYEETYLNWTNDCAQFRKSRGYVEEPLSTEEEEFPLAFSIAMYRDVEQTERLLRAIYQPQNLYCIHVDTKTSLLIHRTVAAIARCFDNVWIASHLDKIKWGDVSVLLPEINCMRDLIRHHRRKFRYFINLTGQEFPLRTNLELVRIARIFNGSNDIAGSISRMDMERVNYRWTHRWSKTYQQTIFYNTFQPKPPFEVNVTFFKGELHGLFSRRMVEYIVEDNVAQSYLRWCWDSGHPSEHYWNTLNYNSFLNAPGGYIGPLDIADQYAPEPVVRAKHWVALGLYGDRKCQGKEQRGICVYGVGDVPWLHGRRELFANKFQLTYEYLALDCLEERHRNTTLTRRPAPDFDERFYRELPTVKYGRKDGLER